MDEANGHAIQLDLLAGGPERATGPRMLLVEDSEEDALVVSQMVARAHGPTAHIERACSLDAAMTRLALGGIDVVLLDLSLPDSRGLETIGRLRAVYPDVACVVVSAHHDEALAVQAVRDGAQDYLVKGEATPSLLGRGVRFALERHHLLLTERRASSRDELTGLYNRRGFMSLAAGQHAFPRRPDERFLLLLGDLDGLKQINDTFGHPAGDQALRSAAGVLHTVVRLSDVVARLGGDEFAALLVGSAMQTPDALTKRVRRLFRRFNARSELPYRVNLTVGVIAFDAQTESSTEGLLAKADAALYGRKRKRRKSERTSPVEGTERRAGGRRN